MYMVKILGWLNYFCRFGRIKMNPQKCEKLRMNLANAKICKFNTCTLKLSVILKPGKKINQKILAYIYYVQSTDHVVLLFTNKVITRIVIMQIIFTLQAQIYSILKIMRLIGSKLLPFSLFQFIRLIHIFSSVISPLQYIILKFLNGFWKFISSLVIWKCFLLGVWNWACILNCNGRDLPMTITGTGICSHRV